MKKIIISALVAALLVGIGIASQLIKNQIQTLEGCL